MTDSSESAPEDTPSESQEGNSSTRNGAPASGAEETTTKESRDTANEDGPAREAVLDAFEALDRPVATADQLGRALEISQEEASQLLDQVADTDAVKRLNVSHDPVVYYPTDWAGMTRRERVVPFPDDREIVIDQPRQRTRARCAQFAHVDTVTEGRYRYRIRPEDIWAAPFDDLADLLLTLRRVLPERVPNLEAWIEDQWSRAEAFRLSTHEEGYVVLEARSASLLSNVANQHLEEGQLRAELSDTEAWVAEEAIGAIKRTLYEAGYPVADERDLDRGEPLEIDVTLSLRDYQQDWVERFTEAGAGVLVGPPGSGKTVAAMAIMATVGGETLILVPGRDLATQWREELIAKTTIDPADVGVYHGGQKQRRPVTIATYQVAGMDRHRQLFDAREWGLIVFDEAHHVPSPVFRTTTALQSRHRLGLTATPVRESDDETDIYTLIGPPIGTDWEALFDAGYVAEPEIELHYVSWDNEAARNTYASANGHERRQLAATNPAKVEAIQDLIGAHESEQVLVFVDYLDQGEAIADAIDAPFISGETRHARRQQLLAAFRDGDESILVLSRVGDEGIDLPAASVAIVASGLGGSRRQGAQRAGRTMRPTGSATQYVLVTRGTEEEDFARRRTTHLAGKGVRVREVHPNDNGSGSGV